MLPLFGKKRPPAEPPAPRSIEVGSEMRDFFVFRNVLFARGLVDKPDGAEPRISVRLWDGTVRPVAHAPDDFNPSSPGRCHFSFNLPLPPNTPIESLEKITVVYDFPAGRCERGRLTADAVARDAFLTSESGFWAEVRSNPGARVLEIGSRARSGINRRGLFPASCQYTGFDIVAGENVDCVGNAHTLSRHLPSNHFDFVFSVSVWEHLAMPWLVSLELNKVMKPGGLAMINTNQSWPSHEEPWDYFRFSDFCWDALFNRETGFEIVTRGTGIPCVMGSSQLIPSIHACRVDWHYGYLATRVVARKVGETGLSWPVDPDLVAKGNYPQ
jgi:SAM-dependent methyltransferase